MLHFDGTNLVYAFHWWHLLIVNAVYGYIIHLHSMKRERIRHPIYIYPLIERRILSALFSMLYCMTIDLPIRMFYFLCGIILFIIGGISGCGFHMNNLLHNSYSSKTRATPGVCLSVVIIIFFVVFITI